MRLFGLMVVRNAADLLEVSIPYHLAQGVERFLVFDHASTDATADQLEDFAASGLLEWSRVEGPFCKERWINELALEATLQGADWIVPIDADEFWSAGPDVTVRDLLEDTTAAAIEARIVHFIQQADQLESTPEGLLRMVFRVGPPQPGASPLEGEREGGRGLPPFLADESAPKWLCRADADLWIDRGNHRVEGVEGPTPATTRIACLHAPLRSRAALLERHQPLPALDPGRRLGESWHLQRWKELGTEPAVVEQEWLRNSARGDRIIASGIRLVADRRLHDALRPWVEHSTGRGLSVAARMHRPPAPTTRSTGERERILRAGLRRLQARLRERDQVLEVQHRRIETMGAELETVAAQRQAECLALTERLERAEARVAAAAPELETWRAVQASKAFRLWLATIRLRRALGLARPAAGFADPVTGLEERGFGGPLRVFSPEDCGRLLALLRRRPPWREWAKDGATSSRVLYEVAAHPLLARVVEVVLGPDALLWGASLIEREPGENHPWHTDIESSAPEGGTLSVWIGLENVGAGSGLKIVPYSHRFGATLQEVAASYGLRRGEPTAEDIGRWAGEREARSAVVELMSGDGEAVFFDGRLWHSSANRSAGRRSALLLQYTRRSHPIRLPDLSNLEWPFRWLEEPRPPCLPLSVRGPRTPANRVVNPPPRSDGAAGPPLAAAALSLELPRAPEPPVDWRARQLIFGPTANLTALSCHVSALAPDHCPHPPHQHPEEELVAVLDGEVELQWIDASGRPERHVVGRGDCAYYPAEWRHTLRTAAHSNASYVVLKWTGRAARSGGALAARVVRYGEGFPEPPAASGFSALRVFDASTLHLERLHCHGTTLAPGAGYSPHRDDHDVAIVLIAGEIEALGTQLGAPGFLFAPAGEPHGMLNPGEVPARYWVFEFEGRAPHGPDLTGFESFAPALKGGSL